MTQEKKDSLFWLIDIKKKQLLNGNENWAERTQEKINLILSKNL